MAMTDLVQPEASSHSPAARSQANLPPISCTKFNKLLVRLIRGKPCQRSQQTGQDFPRGVLVQPEASSRPDCSKRSSELASVSCARVKAWLSNRQPGQRIVIPAKRSASRDLSKLMSMRFTIPCLQRTAPHCAAHGMTLRRCAIALVLVLCAPAYAQQKLPNLFTVGNVKAAAEAANAVDAKKLATQSAETRAFRLLVSRLTDFKSGARIPDLPAEQVERLVSDIDVRGEGVSGTSYVATFGVNFSERSIIGLLRQYGVHAIVDRGPEILIIPVFIEDGAAKTADRNPWRIALTNLDLAHAPVPAKVAPTRGDLTASIAKAYFANQAASVETLKTQYKTTQILMAVAELNGGGDSLTMKLAGSDALGLFSLQREVKARDGIDEAALESAARLAFDTVQERWKMTRGGSPAVATAAASSRESSEAPPAGDLVSVQVTAEFSGLKEWQVIRSRLQGVPGVQHWDLRSVNPRSAEIGFDFPGGPERLAEMAGARGLSVESGPDGLIVKSR